jgi:hypothetical protein
MTDGAEQPTPSQQTSNAHLLSSVMKLWQKRMTSLSLLPCRQQDQVDNNSKCQGAFTIDNSQQQRREPKICKKIWQHLNLLQALQGCQGMPG